MKHCTKHMNNAIQKSKLSGIFMKEIPAEGSLFNMLTADSLKKVELFILNSSCFIKGVFSEDSDRFCFSTYSLRFETMTGRILGSSFHFIKYSVSDKKMYLLRTLKK